MRASFKNRLKGLLKDKDEVEAPSEQLQSLTLTQNAATSTAAVTAETADDAQTRNSSTETQSEPRVINLTELLINQAYDELKQENPKLVDAYEAVLSKDLKHSAANEATIAQDSFLRREQMLALIEKALQRTEKDASRKRSVATIVRSANQVRDIISQSLKPSPEAAIIWAAFTATLPLILNANEQSEKHRDGVDLILLLLKKTNILSPRTLIDSNAESLRREHTTVLYKKILEFLMKSACYCSKNRVLVVLGDSIKHDDWDEQIKGVRDAEATLRAFCNDVNPLSQEDNKCMAKLYITTPCMDKERIENKAGHLLRDCYKWILHNESYLKWCRGEGDARLLWIRGAPGKGKTMLLCGIIDELGLGTSLAYFFCQATYDKTNNNAPAVLRGLIWMLADNNPGLIQHIKAESDRLSDSVFEGPNAFILLSKLLKTMLLDLDDTTLIIDALDECEFGREDLINLIKQTSMDKKFRVNWLISSRPWSSIESHLGEVPKLSLDLEKTIDEAVQTYILLKVEKLANEKEYSKELKQFVTSYLSTKSGETFLWAALVCTRLRNVNKIIARKTIQELPPTLPAIYNRMLEHVSRSEESEILCRLLAITTYAFRPVSVSEIGNLIDVLKDDFDLESIVDLIGRCGSFLVVRDSIVEFVHQSAQEHIRSNLPFAKDVKAVHLLMYECSLKAMLEVLDYNIYDIENMAIRTEDVRSPSQDPLQSVKYSCLYWAQHLEQSESVSEQLSDSSTLAAFFYTKYLCWIEALGLLQTFSTAIYMMNILYKIMKVLRRSSLADFILDARRFVLHFQYVLNNFPLQMPSCLLFCPIESLLRERYSNMIPDFVTRITHARRRWPDRDALFATKIHMPCSIVCSHDGSQVAVGGRFGDIEIYDMHTGSLIDSVCIEEQLRQTARMKFEIRAEVQCLAFNITNTGLVFLTQTSKEVFSLYAWTIHTAEAKHLKDFSYTGNNLYNLSLDSRYVAYQDNLTKSNELYEGLYVYNTKTEDTFILGLGHDQRKLKKVIFSTDSTKVGALWYSGEIEIWDAEARSRDSVYQQFLKIVDYHTEISLSHGGELLALGELCGFPHYGSQRSIKIFDVLTKSLLWQKSWPVEDYRDHGNLCVFYRQSSLLCLVQEGKYRIHDGRTGVPVAVISGNSGEYHSLSDCQIIVSDSKIIVATSTLIEIHGISGEPYDNLEAGKASDSNTDTENTDSDLDPEETDSNPDIEEAGFALNTGERNDSNSNIEDTDSNHQLESDEIDVDGYNILAPRWIRQDYYYIPKTDPYGKYWWAESPYNEGKYIIAQHYTGGRIIVFVHDLDGERLVKYASIDIPKESDVVCSQDALHVAYMTNSNTNVYSVETQTIHTHTSTWPEIRPRYVLGRRLSSHPRWSPDGHKLVRVLDHTVLIWTSALGFQGIQLELGLDFFWLSHSGDKLACQVKGSVDLTYHERRKSSIIHIWNLDNQQLLSTINLPFDHDTSIITNILFPPNGSLVTIITGEGVYLHNVDGTLVCQHKHSGDPIWSINYMSSTSLRTNRGIIFFENGQIRFGTKDEPFMNGNWIYRNGKPLLLLWDGHWKPRAIHYVDGRLVLIDRDDTTILKFCFDTPDHTESLDKLIEQHSFHS